MADHDTNGPTGQPFKIDLDSEPSPPPKAQAQADFMAGFKEAPATPIIMAINFLVFGLMVASTGGQAFMSPTQRTLLQWGADYGPLALTGEYWRTFTSMFVHIGIIHIAMNMYILWDVGRILERLYGTSKFLVIYLLAGLGGAVASLYFNPNVLSAGASGAVFGAFGALLAIFREHNSSFEKSYIQSATRSVVFLLIFNLLWGLSQKGIDNAAHVGGFFTGVLAGFSVLPATLGDKRWSGKNIAWALFLLIMIAAAGYGDYQQFNSQPPIR